MTRATPDTVLLSADGATAEFALRGAELRSWQVGGRELIWQRDPAWWADSAPVLFPVVGQVAGGVIRVDGRAYPMDRHGFARKETFRVVEASERAARLRLEASERTLAVFPFRFQLDLVATLGPADPDAPAALAVTLEVSNTGEGDLPYAVGWHPAFPWPLAPRDLMGHDPAGRDPAAPDFAGHAVTFDQAEDPGVMDVTGDGLLDPGSRRVPFEGRRLPLEAELFEDGALILTDVKSRSLRYSGPGGAALEYAVDGFPHIGLWTRPGAPYLSIEALSGHSDPSGYASDVFGRASQRRLAPGDSAKHRVALRWTPGGG